VVSKICLYCKKEFVDETRSHNRLYCSKKCQSKNWHESNPKKAKEYDEKYKKEHPDKLREYNKRKQKENRKKNPNKYRGYHLKHHYGINFEDKKRMYSEQEGLCKICFNYIKFEGKDCCLDHDHTTGKIRGLLCHYCVIIVIPC